MFRTCVTEILEKAGWDEAWQTKRVSGLDEGRCSGSAGYNQGLNCGIYCAMCSEQKTEINRTVCEG